MQSISFLTPPKITSSEEPYRTWIHAEISIASQTANTIYDGNVTIIASLLSDSDKDTPTLTESYIWEPGASSLKIDLDVTSLNVIWPAKVKVAVQNQDIIRLTDVVVPKDSIEGENPYINGASSEVLQEAQQNSDLAPRIERQFVLSSDRLLRICESFDKMPASQLRPIGVTMLAYIDSVIANKQDTIPELDEKLALATSKRLHIVDFCNNCGIVGIGIGQLIPDCEVVILDAPGDHAIIETNIHDMFAAMQSSVEYEHVNSKKARAVVNKAKPTDLIFLTDYLFDKENAQAAMQILTELLQNSPRVVIVLAQEAARNDGSIFQDAIIRAGGVFCGRVHPSLQEGAKDSMLLSNVDIPPEFYIDVYRGKAAPSRAVRRIREQQERQEQQEQQHTRGF